jgi:FHA domain-containing protein/cytochrome c3-like protein
MVNFIIERIAGSAVVREEIAAPMLEIGRAATAHVRSGDPAVSIEHATIDGDGEGYWIVDRGSLTGTYVEMRNVARARLHDGDRVEIGDLHFEVLDADPGKPLVLRLTVQPHGSTSVVEAAHVDYLQVLSLARPWLTKTILAAIVAAATLFTFASVLMTRSRRVFMPGTLSSAHERVKALDQCNRCHRPFQAVSTASCRQCHEQNRHTMRTVFAEPECANCHPEHQDHRVLASVATRRCTENCHENVAFGPSHPQFSAAMPEPFNHTVHDGSECATCHELQPGGLYALRRGSCADCHGSDVTVPVMRAKFYVAAEFTHEKHRQLPCAKCHQTPHGISLPSREVCAECHGARAGVRPSPCVTCHRYHSAGRPLRLPAVARRPPERRPYTATSDVVALR